MLYTEAVSCCSRGSFATAMRSWWKSSSASLHTNCVRRFLLHVAPEARVLDCPRVEVIPAWELITQGGRQNPTLQTLWREALDSVARQQKRYLESGTWRHLKLRGPPDLQPFAVV